MCVCEFVWYMDQHVSEIKEFQFQFNFNIKFEANKASGFKGDVV